MLSLNMKNSFLVFLVFSFFLVGSENEIDIVIPAIEKDLLTLNLCIDYAKKNIQGVRRVIVVSPRVLTDRAEWFSEANFPFSLFDVARELGHVGIGILGREGWYFQQLLKFYAPFVIDGISKNVLILDADTLFLKPHAPIDEEGKVVFNVFPWSYTPPIYFAHMQKLCPSFYQVRKDVNSITHHAMFQYDKLSHLFKLVEDHHKKPFWLAFLHSVNLKNVRREKSDMCFWLGASEYTIYFNFHQIYYEDATNIRIPKMFNGLQSLKDLKGYEDKGFDMVACHHWARK